VHLLVATAIAGLAAAGQDHHRTRHLSSAGVKIERSGLDVKGAVDHLVGRFQRHLDLAGIGAGDEGLFTLLINTNFKVG